ncbi:unnamed protein product [Dovyalis caffra]|uniref:Uncharacterized protein n=1 Tax=Dovyalis caffra TaxID=77055 RepID=A0AAV1RKG4_9ROSI|nr:unnamed protein product [Dovyalis caffra]
MSPVRKHSYCRLRNEGWFDEDAEEERALRRIRNFSRLKKFTIRKRSKIRIPGLRRFLRKKARLLSRVKVSWLKAWNRLKNGQAHMNDLFGGNFLVMQVRGTSASDPNKFTKSPMKGKAAEMNVFTAKKIARRRARRLMLAPEYMLSSSLRNLVSRAS